MIRRTHSVRERLNSRLLSRDDLLSRGGNLTGAYNNKHYAFAPDEVNFGPHHEIRIPLPDMKKEDLDVCVVNDILIVKGTASRENILEDSPYIRSEKDLRSFESVFDLQDHVDVDNIVASFINGELIIKLFLDAGKRDTRRNHRQILIK